MKATNFSRFIDDLGRIIIPKEVRQNQRIREGDCFEIFTDNDMIILKKKSGNESNITEDTAEIG